MKNIEELTWNRSSMIIPPIRYDQLRRHWPMIFMTRSAHIAQRATGYPLILPHGVLSCSKKQLGKNAMDFSAVKSPQARGAGAIPGCCKRLWRPGTGCSWNALNNSHSGMVYTPKKSWLWVVAYYENWVDHISIWEVSDIWSIDHGCLWLIISPNPDTSDI